MSKVINWFVYSNFWISIAAVALTYSSSMILKLSHQWQLYCFIFLATFLTYNLSAFYITYPVSKKFLFIQNHQNKIQFLAICATFLNLIVALLVLKNHSILFLIHLVFISIFYTIPFPIISNKRYTLRQIPYLKTILVGYVWASVSVLFPYIHLKGWQYNIQIIQLFFIQFFFIIAITLPFDIRDFCTDKAVGLKTLAQKSIIKTKLCSILILVIANIICALSFELVIFLPFLITCLIAGHLIYFALPQRSELYYTGWIDGTIILQVIFLKLSAYLVKITAI